MHCTKCNIAWAQLLTCDINSEDQIDVCPICLTDMFLIDKESAALYFRCGITGSVINMKTKEVLHISHPIRKVKEPVAKPAMKRTVADWERLEDAGLEAYFNTGNPEDYFKAFRNQ